MNFKSCDVVSASKIHKQCTPFVGMSGTLRIYVFPLFKKKVDNNEEEIHVSSRHIKNWEGGILNCEPSSCFYMFGMEERRSIMVYMRILLVGNW